MSHGKKVELPSGDISDKLKLSKGEVKAHNPVSLIFYEAFTKVNRYVMIEALVNKKCLILFAMIA